MGYLSKEDITEIVGDRKIRKAVETGLWKGKQLKTIAECFDFAFGVELDDHYFSVCEKKFKGIANIGLFHGDSRVHLKKILSHTKEPMAIFLDSHYCHLEPPIKKSVFPLWDELEMLSKRNYSDIVIVDDVHTFGRERKDLRYTNESVEWESVTSKEIMNYFPGCKSEIIKDSFVIWR